MKLTRLKRTWQASQTAVLSEMAETLRQVYINSRGLLWWRLLVFRVNHSRMNIDISAWNTIPGGATWIPPVAGCTGSLAPAIRNEDMLSLPVPDVTPSQTTGFILASLGICHTALARLSTLSHKVATNVPLNMLALNRIMHRVCSMKLFR